MITYKEFEVIRTLLKRKESFEDLAEFIYTHKHYYVFKNIDEVRQIINSLEEKGYLYKGTVTQSAMLEIEPLKVENAVIGSVFNFVSLFFHLIPEAGCGQSPRALVNTGFLDISDE